MATTPTAAPLAMATAADTLTLLGRVNAMLDMLSEQISRAAILGTVNLEQSERLLLSLRIVNGLQALFLAERARQAALFVPSQKES